MDLFQVQAGHDTGIDRRVSNLKGRIMKGQSQIAVRFQHFIHPTECVAKKGMINVETLFLVLVADHLLFKEAIDVMDGAQYTKRQIKLLYYPQKSYQSLTTLQNLTTLQKVHIISSMFHSGDPYLNWEIFKTLLNDRLENTPVSGKAIWKLRPLMFYRALLAGYQEWREWVDSFIYFDKDAKCVIQDYRKKGPRKGNVDKFYPYIKYPQTSYSLHLRNIDEETARVGIGSNIFNKQRCKVNIGKLCSLVGRKFGEGAGGGHYYVGGATIDADKSDDAVNFVLGTFRKEKIEE